MQRKSPTKPERQTVAILFAIAASSVCLVLWSMLASSMELFQVKLVEQDNDSRLIATSNYNYAMVSPKLATKNWRTVSVNGDKVLLTTTEGEQQRTTRAALGDAEMAFVEALRDELANGSGGGYSHMSMTSGGGSTGGGFMMSSNTGSGMSQGGSMSSSSTYSTGGQQASSLLGGGGGGEMSYNMKDQNNFSVSRSDFPFNWSRVFINGDLATMIYRNGEVEMQPMSLLEPSQQEAVQRMRSELAEMQRTQTRQIANTMQHSMDMVSNVFNNIMGSFPKPPDYQSAVGGMFGNNFPFGPNNSPFSGAAGWPFASPPGGGGAAALAVAGRRR